MTTCTKYGRCFEALGVGERPLVGDRDASPGEP
jgi:hypothetical protein